MPHTSYSSRTHVDFSRLSQPAASPQWPTCSDPAARARAPPCTLHRYTMTPAHRTINRALPPTEVSSPQDNVRIVAKAANKRGGGEGGGRGIRHDAVFGMGHSARFGENGVWRISLTQEHEIYRHFELGYRVQSRKTRGDRTPYTLQRVATQGLNLKKNKNITTHAPPYRNNTVQQSTGKRKPAPSLVPLS